MNAQARLGAFFLLSLVILSLFSIKIGRLQWFEEEGRIVEALFHDASGIAEQTPVLMAGVKVGAVSNITLENNEALVRMHIQPGIVLPRSTKAHIEGGGLIGEKYIALSATPGDTNPLEGNRIPTDSTGNVSEILRKTSSIADNAHQVFDKIGKVADTLSTMLRENREDLHGSLEHIHLASKEIQAVLTRHRNDLEQSLGELPKVMKASRRFFEEGMVAVQQLRGILTDNRENLYRALFEFRKTAENLEILTDDLRYNPWKLMIEKPEIKRDMDQHLREKQEEMILSTGRMGPSMPER
ncbi:MAG: MCE family protein [Zetaproteobacteria bacterium]|nr:MAG: MCE family protein [Zetaproteobacteria bacterium]